MKKRILYYALDPNDTTSFWRMAILVYIQSPEFELINAHSVLPKENGQMRFTWSSLMGLDGIIIQRPFTADHAALIMTAKNMGLKVILDYDDDLWNVPFTNPTYEMYKHAVNSGSLNKCAQLADSIWCSTKSICDVVGYKAVHVPNSHNQYLFPLSQKRNNSGRKLCMFRGGSSHRADVMEVADKMVTLMNENTNWTFAWMGDRFEYMEIRTGDNHHIIPGMPIMEYFRYLNQENPSLMLFPLQNSQFNRGKSNICFLEATFSGAVLYGNKELPEFNNEFVQDITNVQLDGDWENVNNRAWEYICDTLLLEKINNKIREQNIIEVCACS